MKRITGMCSRRFFAKILLLFILGTGIFWTGCGQKAETADSIGTGEIRRETEAAEALTETAAPEQIPDEGAAGEEDLHPYDFTLAFAGDMNLADNWNTMQYYSQQENGIYDCIDPRLIQMMQEADLTCVNLECCLSGQGSPMEGKAHTFRGDPSHAAVLSELGVDLANLANNHVYDYGIDAFLDMLDVLKEAGISYAGAGADASEAEEPFYTELDGKTVAIVSASRAEKYIMTPEATDMDPGVFRCYDMTRLLQVTAEASQKADFVIAYIHWGTEYSEELEDAQTEGARALIDAGADVVLGAHPHCLQGAEFYDGKPILYSLGNYWFNEKTLDTVLVKLHFYGDDEEQHVEPVLVPARQENHYTRILTEEADVLEWKAHIESMEPAGVKIGPDGIMMEYKKEVDEQ